MKKANSSNLYAEENAARLIAAQTVLLTTVAIVTPWKILLVFLTIDFAIRAFTFLPTPMALIAKRAVVLFGLIQKPRFAAPKKFAAGLGFLFSITITLLFLMNLINAAIVVGIILIICAVIEAVFKVCLGCYVYNWIVAPLTNGRNNLLSIKK